MIHKYFYGRKIQISNYIPEAPKFEPIEIGVEADTYEEAQEEVERLLKDKLKEIKSNIEPF